MISQSPVYNLMVVLKETGLKADVLRAWERRYDLPHPQRTAGGHRLYSAYDIATLKWLKDRQSEGLNISGAVQLWKSLLASGQNPLEDVVLSLHASSLSLPGGANLESLRQDWLEACLSFDTGRAEAALNQALALHPVEMVCRLVLQQGLKMMGDQWYSGKISVQQEHFASSLAVRRLESLISTAPKPTRTQTILVGCPAGELHTFPALLLCLYLQRAGLKVVYLGADTPNQNMDSAISTVHPDVVILIAQRLSTAHSLSETAAAVQRHGVTLGYGGLIFNLNPTLRERIPGTFLGESLDQALDGVEQLIQNPRTHPVADLEGNWLTLAQLFRQSRPLIENQVLAELEKAETPIDNIQEINAHFGVNLAAALEFGDLNFMEGELDWINKLLSSRRIAGQQLTDYLAAYNQGLHAVMGEEGKPITRWIEEIASRAPISW